LNEAAFLSTGYGRTPPGSEHNQVRFGSVLRAWVKESLGPELNNLAWGMQRVVMSIHFCIFYITFSQLLLIIFCLLVFLFFIFRSIVNGEESPQLLIICGFFEA